MKKNSTEVFLMVEVQYTQGNDELAGVPFVFFYARKVKHQVKFNPKS